MLLGLISSLKPENQLPKQVWFELAKTNNKTGDRSLPNQLNDFDRYTLFGKAVENEVQNAEVRGGPTNSDVFLENNNRTNADIGDLFNSQTLERSFIDRIVREKVMVCICSMLRSRFLFFSITLNDIIWF